jgi:lipopolysaccharide/colanic/teichoic acid biosynthesis glycosyltransferase
MNLSLKIPGRRLSRTPTQHPFHADALRGARRPTALDQNVLAQAPWLQTSDCLPWGDVLPKHHFLQQLHRERSRTDRSKAPLSIALFTSECGDGSVAGLLDVLRTTKRETDILGYLGDHRIAILLPDTNAQGAQCLTEKVVTRADNLPLSATTRTYPDQVFDDLMIENHDEKPGQPDLYPFFSGEALARKEGKYRLKRALDVVGALVGLVLLSPLMLLIALAVAITSPGPVIFRQVRLGQRGAPFFFYKFRSMYCDVDDRVHREYVTSLIKGDLEAVNQGDASKPLYKLICDPRVTPVGRIIRKTSLDELPQLFNVLRGNMSLVGPRPPVPYEVEKYQSWHLRRILEARPGITGLWQVEGRSKTSFDDMVRLDLRYIHSCCLALDLKILLKTIQVVLDRDGAA